LVVIFGPPAVGKMAVGLELRDLTGLKLLHNHMAIELALQFFAFDDPSFTGLVGAIRRRIVEDVARSALPGLILTYVWAFDDPRDRRQPEEFAAIFAGHVREAYFVELEASLEERLSRNTSARRLSNKPSKRDARASRARLLEAEAAHKLNSTTEFDGADNYLRINKTQVSAKEAAVLIRDRFALPRVVPPPAA
jgi:hypothetical protein